MGFALRFRLNLRNGNALQRRHFMTFIRSFISSHSIPIMENKAIPVQVTRLQHKRFNIPLALFLLLVAVVLVMHFSKYGDIPEVESATVSEQLKIEADANLEKAHRLGCLRVHARQGACYENNALCPEFWKSLTWFQDEWGQEDRISCTSNAQSALNMGEEIVDEY